MSWRAVRWACGIGELPANEKNVVVQLGWRHNGETGQCNPSLETISADTGLSRSSVCRALTALAGRGLVKRTHTRSMGDQGLQLHTHYTLAFSAVSQRDSDNSAVSDRDSEFSAVSQGDSRCVTQTLTLSQGDTVTRKKNKKEEQEGATRKRTQKRRVEISANSDELELPQWLPRDLWIAFHQMRVAKKKPMTAYAAGLILDSLQKCYAAGNDAIWALRESVKNNWTDVYPAKAPKRAMTFIPESDEDSEAWLRGMVQ
ncbi:helix-turn-helix domain-containing protein [Terriglobus sp. TAA 43]|uniref:helix-turn-helix domain-containing protein n=1 Tax=Terriglobus sp. TAA 43 TaxID=278961 RepID=UPI00068B678F|nr:helix-turn-helix domain-containing protein [Terriglobus sp. TAA 43]